jgi:hypothetical protein
MSGRTDRLLALAALLLLAPDCRTLDKIGLGLEEEFEDEVRDRAVEAVPGNIPDPEEPVLQEQIVVNSVLPNRGETGGGLLVEIIGLRFEEGMTVWFGDVPVAPRDTNIVSDTRIHVITPESPVGVVDVAVAESSDRVGLLELGFEFYDPVTVSAVTPTRGPSLGGSEVVVEGTGFIDGTTVRFGTLEPVDSVIVSSTELAAVTPRLPRDAYAITVSNRNGSDTLQAAFTSWDPVRVAGVQPFAGPVSGGTAITVQGTGLVSPTRLWLGDQELAGPVSTPDETGLAAITLPAAPAVEGLVDVAVANENTTERTDGIVSLEDAFVFIDETDTSPRVVAILPSVGLTDGGGALNIAGVGFDDPSTTVTVDGAPIPCTIQNDMMITCTAPPSSERTVDVRVVAPGLDQTLPGAYTYIDLRIDALVFNRGAIAGGTFVEVYGNGYGQDMELYFDGAPARDVKVEGTSFATLRTPPGDAGTVDVRVSTQGVEVTVPQAFTYFDPFNGAFWTGGGPIESSVNVTVVDSDTGERLGGAFVMLGDDPTTRYQGFTNASGQITLSGPSLEVDGPITVTGGKPGYALFSWIGVDAQNLIMMLVPIPEPSTPEIGPGPVPAIVRGEVIRIKDDYNYGDDVVRVTTTYASFSLPLPDPGPRSQMFNRGLYELRARGGDLIVIAMAGTVLPDSTFKVHALGFRPFLYTQAGSGEACEVDEDCPAGEICYDWGAGALACTTLYDGIDVTIDTPLRQSLRIELDDPPLYDPLFPQSNAPDTAAARVWYDFGYQGLYRMANTSVPNSNVVVVDMPRALPGDLFGTPFNVVAGVYPAFGNVPQSVVRAYGNTDTTQTVFATPVLGTQTEIEPVEYGSVGNPMRFRFSVNKPSLATSTVHYMLLPEGLVSILYWLAIGPGGNTEFNLPVFPEVAADANPPSGLYLWQMMGLFNEGTTFNHADLDQLLGWSSRAAHISVFEIPTPQ